AGTIRSAYTGNLAGGWLQAQVVNGCDPAIRDMQFFDSQYVGSHDRIFRNTGAWTASDGFGTSILCSNAVFANYLVGDYVKRRCNQTLCSSQRTFKYGRPYA